MNSDTNVHLYVKNLIRSHGLTIKKAAAILGYSTVHLSNFLGGKAPLSEKLAFAIEGKFKVPASRLLAMQLKATTSYSAAAPLSCSATVKGHCPAPLVPPYAPPYLTILEEDITDWGAKNSNRMVFPEFIRYLVLSSLTDITAISFPARERGQDPGWDGVVKRNPNSGLNHPWVPQETSVWELGTNTDTKKKASGDIAKREADPLGFDPKTVTYVFVTTRKWTQKGAWVRKQKSKGIWKDVLAYDSEDLKEWLDTSYPVQAWFAEALGRPTRGIGTLAAAARRWANISLPLWGQPIPLSLFDGYVTQSAGAFRDFLEKPWCKTFTIASSSGDEGLACLQALFESLPERMTGIATPDAAASAGQNTLVLESPEALPILRYLPAETICITANLSVTSRLVEPENPHKTVFILPQTKTRNADIRLGAIDADTFHRALSTVGLSDETIEKLAKETGRQPAALRRRLENPDLAVPPVWAAKENADVLATLALFGSWCSANAADRNLLCELSGVSWPVIETTVTAAREAGAPIWQEGPWTGVYAKSDMLCSLAPWLHRGILDRYFGVAERALTGPLSPTSASDREATRQALLPESISSDIREALADTLPVLAGCGELGSPALGSDGLHRRVRHLLLTVLNPFTPDHLKRHEGLLACYAKADPELFLGLVNNALTREDNPLSFGAEEGRPFEADRVCSEILDVLGAIAQNPLHFGTAFDLICRMAEREVEGQGFGQAVNTLVQIFKASPNPGAIDGECLRAVQNRLFADFPKAAWQVALAQLAEGENAPSLNTANGAEVSFFMTAREAFIRYLLTRKQYTDTMLCDLIRHLPHLSNQGISALLTIVGDWIKKGPTDADLAQVRECLRTSFSCLDAGRAGIATILAGCRQCFLSLTPSASEYEHLWLFKEALPIHPGFDFSVKSLIPANPEAEDIVLHQKRQVALKAIYQQKSVGGVLKLLSCGAIPELIGNEADSFLTDEKKKVTFILRCIVEIRENPLIARLLARSLEQFSLPERILSSLLGHLGDDNTSLALFSALPFDSSTWHLLGKQSRKLGDTYWKNVTPRACNDADAATAVDELLQHDRPEAALFVAAPHLKKLGVSELYRLLVAMASKKIPLREPDQSRLRYEIQLALSILAQNQDPAVSLEEKAGLEFELIELLAPVFYEKESCLESLETLIADKPNEFCRLVVQASQKHDAKARTVLLSLRKAAGILCKGPNEFQRWVRDVRAKCSATGCLRAADAYLGQLLGWAAACESPINLESPVWKAIESSKSIVMAQNIARTLVTAKAMPRETPQTEKTEGPTKEWERLSEDSAISYPFISCVFKFALQNLNEGIDYMSAPYFSASCADIRESIQL